MRTTADENRQFARWIAAKLNRAEAPFTLLIPEGGVSALDAPGQPFYDPEADAALFDELESADRARPRPHDPPPAAPHQRPRLRPRPWSSRISSWTVAAADRIVTTRTHR